MGVQRGILGGIRRAVEMITGKRAQTTLKQESNANDLPTGIETLEGNREWKEARAFSSPKQILKRIFPERIWDCESLVAEIKYCSQYTIMEGGRCILGGMCRMVEAVGIVGDDRHHHFPHVSMV